MSEFVLSARSRVCKTPVGQRFKGMLVLCTHTHKQSRCVAGVKGHVFTTREPLGSKQAEINSVSATKNVNSAVMLRAECISVSSD